MKLTEEEIKEQRRLNQEAGENEYNLPLDNPLDLLDIITQCNKALISDNLVLCTECLRETLGNQFEEESVIKVSIFYPEITRNPNCEGYSCINEGQFRVYFTNKI